MSCQRCDTSWMRSSFGISVHWTTHSVLPNGVNLPFEEAVNGFDVENFADTLASVRAEHCIFTLTHAEQYLAMPNEALEAILPGRTTKRDLTGEVIRALKKRNIRFIAYYNHSCNDADDPAWNKACGYADGIHGDLDLFAQNICNVIAWIGRRYGTDLHAWWFDSGYTLDPRGPSNRVKCDMGSWQFPWEKLDQAAKSGNPHAAPAINAGVGSRFLYTEHQDYYCGEAVHLDREFVPEAIPGMQDHRWICQDDTQWVFTRGKAEKGFTPPRFSDAVLKEAIRRYQEAGHMVTLNILIDQAGKLNPEAVEQLKRIRRG